MTAVFPERSIASPFKGLTPFEDSDLDALLFFGREREREVIAANLLASRLTVLYGASGVGKSSVLRAGVAHHLRAMAKRNLETRGHPEFAVVVFGAWTADPMAALLDTVQSELEEVFGPDRAPTRRDATPTDTLHDWTSDLDCDLLLVLDQTEEYFLYHEHEEGQGTFAGELPDLVTRPGLRVSVLLAIRDDALSRLDRFKGRIPNLFANYLRLDHLDRRAGRAAVVGPIEQYNRLAETDPPVSIEPELVEALLDETTAGRVNLGQRGRGVVRQPGTRTRVEAPYLQLVLHRLWEEERGAGSHVLRLETLERLGGANEVVRSHLERALAELPPQDKDVAADVFSHLVTPSGTKIAHGLHDLAEYAHVAESQLEPIVARLVNERILRPVARRENDDDAPYEIFHDVLGDAVLAWRTSYESERRVTFERVEADRRHRRVLRILVLAFAGFFAMSAVAAYAVQKRAEARDAAALATEQAAIAEQARSDAEGALEAAEAARSKEATARKQEAAARKQAEVARLDAIQQKNAATAAEADARAQRGVAVSQRIEADRQRAIAEDEKANAVEQRGRAEESARQAEQQARLADSARRDAEKQRVEADSARRSAVAQQNLARTLLLTEQARGALTKDPVKTLELALRAANIQTRPETQSVMLHGLVQLRVEGIARGGRPVSAAILSRDGAFFVTASGNRTGDVRVFGTRPLRLLQRLEHGLPVTAAAVSPDGRSFATGDGRGQVNVWRVAGGAPQRTLVMGGRARGLEFSPDGRLLAAASEDRTVRVWDVASGVVIRQFLNPNAMRSASFSPDGRLLVTVPFAVDRFARVYDLQGAAEPVARLEHQGVVVDAEFAAPDGQTLVTTGRRNVYVWDRATWRMRYPFLTGHTTGVHGVSISPDGRRAASYDDGGFTRVWRLDTGAQVTMAIRHDNSINGAVFSPDGAQVLTASSDSTARIWTGGLYEVYTPFVGHEEPVLSATYFPSGDRILTASADGTARIWAASAEPTLQELGSERHAGGATAADVSPNGRLAASGGADGNVYVWRTSGGRLGTLGHGAPVTVVQFSSDGGRLLTAGADGTARVWRISDGELLVTIQHGAAIRDAELSRDRRTIVTAGGTVAKTWTAAGAGRFELRHTETVTSVAISPDGTRVVTGGDDNVGRVWSTTDGRQLHALEGHLAPVVAVAFSPDGSRIATASADTTAALWETASGARIRELAGHLDALTSVRFSPNGRRLVTAAVDGQVRSWDAVAEGKPVLLGAHSARVADARFSRDGRWVVTAGPSAAGLFVTATGERIYFLRGHGAPLVTATFAGGSRRIVTAGADGSARTYVCTICGSFAELRKIARDRLAAIRDVG